MIYAPHSPLLCDIAAHAANNPDKTAVVVGDNRVTYAGLTDNVGRAALFLRSCGLERGDRVMLAANKEVEFIYCYLAAHLLGLVNVVVDSASPQERIDYIVSVTHPALVLGNGISVDGCRPAAFDAIDWSACETQAAAPAGATAGDVADVMFTTGTTGVPKGVCLSHANVAASARNTNGFIGTDAGDIEALALPLSHSFGLGRLRCVLMAGATIVLVNNFANLKTFFNVIEQEYVTGFGMVPAAWQYIKRLSGRRIARFAEQLRYVEIGSAAMPVEDKRLLMELLPHTRLCMHYGLTEASRALFTEFHAAADHLESVGRPSSDRVEAVVLDDEGNAVPDGVDGEICVRGNMVTGSYLLPDDNRGAFFGDWFRTGDWGHRAANGDFFLTGRKKELINVGGEKVSPVAIEQAIMRLGIADCACIAVPDPNGVLGEVPKAFLCRTAGAPSIEEVKAGLTQLLPAHEIPVEWEWVDNIPRTASGKIQRLKLKQ